MSAEQGKEDLKTLGSGFKTARESKGFSLKDANEKTRISVTILDAIENGNIHLLPPGVYARNFIRNYAAFLGVDSQAILEHIKKESEQTSPPPVLQKEDTGAALPVFDWRRWKYLAVGAAVLILICVLVWFLNSCWYTGNSAGMPAVSQGDAGRTVIRETLVANAGSIIKEDATPPVSAAPLQATPDTLTSPVAGPGSSQPSSSPVQEAQPRNRANVPSDVNQVDLPARESAGTAGPYQLGIEAKEKTWLRIKADKGETFQVIMKPGERMNRNARERFTLDIGNAAGVSIFFQGRELENLGKQGQVVHLSLP